MNIGKVALIIFAVAIPAALAETGGAPLTLDQVLSRMGERDRIRSAELTRYTCLRRYALNNRRFHKRAEITVRMTYLSPGRKTFETVAERGPSIIRDKVLRRMFQAEEEASGDELRRFAQITPLNYDFELLGTELREGRLSYALAAVPKRNDKFLMRGRVWIDGEDFAVVRVEAGPAVNPSAFIRNTRIVQQYAKTGEFWLPLFNHSETDSFLFGRTEVTIDSSDYRLAPEVGPTARRRE